MVDHPMRNDTTNLRNHFAAPLGSLTSGNLRFTNGAHQITIRAKSYMRGLCRANFGDRIPIIGVQGGIVTLWYPRASFCDWLNERSECTTELELNVSVPWNIEIRGGTSRLIADLRELRLGSLSLAGGASRVEVVLPAPTGTVPVVIVGGASNVVIHRANGVAARLRVGGGATHLKFNDRHIAAAGGDLDLLDRDYYCTTNRYDMTFTGGANNVSIDKQRATRG